MNISITISNIQHLSKLHFGADLSKNQLICLTGRNGVGKTTLIRTIRNLSINNTFQDTGAPYIFSKQSSVEYLIDETKINFVFNSKLGVVDTKQEIPEEIKDLFSVELPIPHGDRFNHFRRLADIDSELRSKIATGDFEEPIELIEFLQSIYGDTRFSKLKSVHLGKQLYYFILKDEHERFYIREDYLSSGEYFVINLFKQIQQRRKCIVIDEIDISLDASAQVKLISNLRQFCKKYGVNIIFTTHSLPLMKTVNSDELFYMEKDNENGSVSIENRSYNFIKSVLFGFKGFDKYILTEDERLLHYINFLIREHQSQIFFKYQIIYIGGGSQVISLMERNRDLEFLSSDNNILSALDGDQFGKVPHYENVIYLPFSSVEKAILKNYENKKDLPRVDRIDGKSPKARATNLFWKLTKHPHNSPPLVSSEYLYQYLEETSPDGVAEFRSSILRFLVK
jgi:ABC-type multidrug transport system ATPase subunit